MIYKGIEIPDIDLTDAIQEAYKEFGEQLLTDPLTIEYLERTNLHINLVNYFANKIGKSYPKHDRSKITMLLPAYRTFKKSEEERTKEEIDALDWATIIHITGASHHPEYWTDTNLSGFTRKNFTPNGPIDATQMSEEAMEEMSADWCAMSFELGKNTPYEWFDKVNGSRWVFTQEQQDFILSTLDKMWNN